MAKNATATATANTASTAGASAPAVEASKKQPKAFVVYVKADGTVINFPAADADIVRTEFANGVKRDVSLTELNTELQHCAMLQGLAIRTQRSYQAEKDIDKVIESYDETVADLRKGVWIETKTGAPKITLLSQAIVLSLEASGQTVDDARRQSIIEKLKVTEYREKAEANPAVVAHLAQLRLDAAKKRAEEAKAANKKAGPADLAMFD